MRLRHLPRLPGACGGGCNRSASPQPRLALAARERLPPWSRAAACLAAGQPKRAHRVRSGGQLSALRAQARAAMRRWLWPAWPPWPPPRPMPRARSAAAPPPERCGASLLLRCCAGEGGSTLLEVEQLAAAGSAAAGAPPWLRAAACLAAAGCLAPGGRAAEAAAQLAHGRQLLGGGLAALGVDLEVQTCDTLTLRRRSRHITRHRDRRAVGAVVYECVFRPGAIALGLFGLVRHGGGAGAQASCRRACGRSGRRFGGAGNGGSPAALLCTTLAAGKSDHGRGEAGV
jgi:hypothetical protein